MDITFVIMAGGSGTRFWPASRRGLPKQFLNIIGDEEMVKTTVKRVEPLSGGSEVVFVINEAHFELAKRMLKDFHVRLMREPIGCNTAPCIGLAALFLNRENPDGAMIVLPADHYVADVKKFQETLTAAAAYAEKDHLVTIGIPPTRPETGYGYIQRGKEIAAHRDLAIMEVKRFVEKPDAASAKTYVTSGNYLWNAGIFAFKPSVILNEIETHLPKLHHQLMRIEQAIGKPTYYDTLKTAYQEMPNISIDYGVMEKTARPIVVIPGSFGWSDVGNWDSLYELRKSEWDVGNNLVQGKAELVDTESSFIFNKSKQLMALVGMKDVVVIATDDAVLVAHRGESEKMRDILDALKAEKLDKYL